MPEYVVSRAHSPIDDFSQRQFWSDGSFLAQLFFCYLRFFIGWVAILTADEIGFGAGAWGTIAASSLIYYTLFIPYLAVMSFFIEDEDGVPPGYRLFQFFITRSGKEHLDRSHKADETFDVKAFDQKVSPARTDKYQARLEADELTAAAKRARAEAARIAEVSDRHARDEAKRIEAAEEAAQAAEELHRQKARQRAWERRKLNDD